MRYRCEGLRWAGEGEGRVRWRGRWRRKRRERGRRRRRMRGREKGKRRRNAGMILTHEELVNTRRVPGPGVFVRHS